MTGAAAAARALPINRQRVPNVPEAPAVNPAERARPLAKPLDPANKSG
jgi:hypothetical protein